MTERNEEAKPARSPAKIQSHMASSTPDRVVVRGFDLVEDLMGSVNLGDMAFLELTGRLPNAGESTVFNAMLVSLVEHGITPSTLAARLTYVGAPEALQGAVAAGLLGLGSVFVGTIEGAARIVQESIEGASAGETLSDLAAAIVTDYRGRKAPIPGLGHPIHKPVDPRATRLFALAREHAIAGQFVDLMLLVHEEAERQTGRRLPINVTGAIGSIASELGIPWRICRGLGIMARSIGLVAHVLEEIREPMGNEIWRRVEAEVGEL